MMEREWPACDDPDRLLRHLGGRGKAQAPWLAWLDFGGGTEAGAV
jgi:hypothetical protein